VCGNSDREVREFYSRLLSGIDVFHEGKKVRAEVHPLEYVEDF
jgi:hypothetical protein